MKTVLCSNHLCGKEYSVQFEKCPFCGTDNPLDERSRIAMTDINNSPSQDNGGQFNVLITIWIWASIVFVGIKAIILSFANMMFNPFIGCMTIGLTVIGIVSLIYILRAKKWALFLWIAYRLFGALVNTYVLMNHDLLTNIAIVIVNIILMLLALQIKKNGVSAWSIIFKKNKPNTGLHRFDTASNTHEEKRNCGTLFSEIATNTKSKEAHITSQNTNVPIENENTTITKHLEQENLTEIKTKVNENHDYIDSSDSYKHYKSLSNLKDEKHKRQYLIITVLVVVFLGVCIWLAPKHLSQESAKAPEESMKTFDCGLFTFEYPSTFKTSPIQNAPHMVLKLESDDCVVSISYWDYGLNDDASIWNDEYFERYKQMPIENGSLVDIAKVGVQTKEGFVKCLKLKSNINIRDNDITNYTKLLTYLAFHNGYLLVFVFESDGSYPIPIPEHYPTTYPDEIMKGLTLKSNEDNLKAFDDETIDNSSSNKDDEFGHTLNQTIHNEMEIAAQDYNKDLPEKIGYGMTMIRCALEGHSIVYTIRWEGMKQSDFSAEDLAELKDVFIEGMIEEKDSPIMKVMLNRMREYGYDYIYRFVNERGERLCSIKINPSEI